MRQSNSKIYASVGFISIAIIGFLVWLIYLRNVTPGNTALSSLPLFNACMNTAATISILSGLWSIKAGRKVIHGISMTVATFFSSLFFIGYTIHHYLIGDSHFVGSGAVNIVYLLILASHICLSIVVVPMILVTLAFAATQQFTLHKKVTRFTYPIWLYVSVTGVMVYLFLKLSGSIA